MGRFRSMPAFILPERMKALPQRGAGVIPPLLALLLLLGIGPATGRELVRLPVLVYHHIEDPVRSDVSCTPEQFSLQMEALVAAGYTPIGLRDTRVFLVGGLAQVRQPVVITFDDGYESIYRHALPVARRLEIPMVVFMVTSRIGRQPQFTRYLSAQQMREMEASGRFEFGSHTHDLHTDVLRIWSAFHTTPNPVAAVVDRDLEASQKRLQEILGHRAVALAWPYGKYNAETRKAARRRGFLLHFTSRPGYNEPDTDPFGIKRIPITARDTPESVLRKARSYFTW